MVKTPCFQCRGVWVGALVRELRSHMPRGQKKKKALMIVRLVAYLGVLV